VTKYKDFLHTQNSKLSQIKLTSTWWGGDLVKKYTSEDVFEVIETVMNDIRRSILKHLSKVKK